MPKYKLSKDTQALNPEYGSEIIVVNSKQQDQKHLFTSAWENYGPRDLPYPIEEFAFNLPESKHRFDFCWPIWSIALEVDGGGWKPFGGRHSKDSDKVKQNLAVIAGYRIFHYSPKMLKDDPGGCVDQVVSVIRELNGSNY